MSSQICKEATCLDMVVSMISAVIALAFSGNE